MLKKIAILVCFCIMLMLVNVTPKPIFCGEGQYVLYLNSASSNATQIEIESSRLTSVYGSFKNVKGECLKAKNKDIVECELSRLSAEFLFCEEGESFKSSYYYSDKISGYKTINGQKVNIQTAVYQDNYLIGTPMIFGSF